MKLLHRPDLFCWSVFDEARDIDFNSVLWVRDGGNIAIDPLPMSSNSTQSSKLLSESQSTIFS